ncbi:MAG: acetyltransferase [SAR202 cluster bacterium]|nr:acetyltransferase [SAR202 cluster bacterium]
MPSPKLTPAPSTHNRVVFGCGSQARYVADNWHSNDQALPSYFVDVEGTGRAPKEINGIQVLQNYGEALALLTPASYAAVVAHGDNALKMTVASELQKKGFSFQSAVHRQAVISESAHIGEGSIVNPGAVLLPGAKLGRHVIAHSGCVIEHDCVVEDGANIAPGATLAGRVYVGTQAYLYTGCIVIPGVRIGVRAVVGAGAVVLEDVPDDAVVVGNPARRIR